MAGKCSHVGAAGGETGALIGVDGRDSHIITISQLFTCLHLWQLRDLESVLLGRRSFLPCEFRSTSCVSMCLFL